MVVGQVFDWIDTDESKVVKFLVDKSDSDGEEDMEEEPVKKCSTNALH